MQGILLYDKLAYLWPVISPPEDYAEEAVHWRRAIRDQLGPGRHRLLELGVGGGHNLSHLTAEFDAVAVDISPKMLDLSRRLNPDVEHHLGDMRTFRLPGQSFDAVLVHDAICYMQTEDDLRAAFDTARAHLHYGGLLLVAPDLVRDTFRPGLKLRWSTKLEGVEVITEETVLDADPSDTMVESYFTYTITEKGRTASRARRPCDRPIYHSHLDIAAGGGRVPHRAHSPTRRRGWLRGAHVLWSVAPLA